VFADKWMQSEDIMKSQVSQAQKDKGCMISLMYRIQHNTNTSSIEKQVTVRGGHIREKEGKRMKLRR
jgi:hypothetical protein